MRKHGFTLMEVLIVVSILATLASILLFSNLKNQLAKARDSRRKQDLNKLARVFEDYYNDKSHYPPLNNPDDGTIGGAPWGSPFLPYVEELPKDPLSPRQDYYYETDPIVQNFYVLFARLEILTDPDVSMVGCIDGCGPNRAFNYVVHSPNIKFKNNPTGGGLGALPTQPPPIPLPTTPQNVACTYGGCGICDDCGGTTSDCGYRTRCWYTGTIWTCLDSPECVPPP